MFVCFFQTSFSVSLLPLSQSLIPAQTLSFAFILKVSRIVAVGWTEEADPTKSGEVWGGLLCRTPGSGSPCRVLGGSHSLNGDRIPEEVSVSGGLG